MLNLFRRQSHSIRNDILSGLTVALALVPEAIAFAFVAGVSPVIGLYSAFFIGLITAIVGGRPGMISGATGAMAVVVVGLVSIHGVEYLFPTVILCGLLQIAAGTLRIGKLAQIIPHSVMLGFVNGLAIVIGLAQINSFKDLGPSGSLEFLAGGRLLTMALLIAMTMGIIWLLPKLTRAVPASLAAIVAVAILATGINYAQPASESGVYVTTVGDMLRANSAAGHADHAAPSAAVEQPAFHYAALQAGSETAAAVAVRTPDATPAAIEDAGMSGALPTPFFIQYAMVPLTLETFWIILPFALVLCGVGLIESLMTLALIDELTQTQGQRNRECVGQGIANVVCGLFGGMGGCAMIGQSLINVNSGGRGRLSGATAAVCLLLFVLFLAPVIERVPMAALVGVMFMVVIGTFEWASLKMFRRMPLSDVAVMILVTTYTVVMHDLAGAVILGVIVSALVFAWQHATHIFADIKYNEFGSKIYQLHGPLYFASAGSFQKLFDLAGDPADVVIDFYYTRVYDQSGLEAIHRLTEKYESHGKRLHLTHLSDECRRLLARAGDMVEVNLSSQPQFHVASDRGTSTAIAV